MNRCRIEDYSFITYSPYAPPEVGCYLRGAVYDHPKHTDGSYIRTSQVVTIKGDEVTTESGTVYKLGSMSSEYKAWRENHGLEKT